MKGCGETDSSKMLLFSFVYNSLSCVVVLKGVWYLPWLPKNYRDYQFIEAINDDDIWKTTHNFLKKINYIIIDNEIKRYRICFWLSAL